MAGQTGKLTLAGRLQELLRRLLRRGQELLQAGHGHLGIHQLRDELGQLEQRHPEHLTASPAPISNWMCLPT